MVNGNASFCTYHCSKAKDDREKGHESESRESPTKHQTTGKRISLTNRKIEKLKLFNRNKLVCCKQFGIHT